MLLDYKHIGDLHRETGTNSETYFSITKAARRVSTLPTNFDLFVYHDVHEWLKNKPTMTPLHFQDLLHLDNGNFQSPPCNSAIDLNDLFTNQCTTQESTLHAYTSTTNVTYDYVVDCKDDFGIQDFRA